MCGLNTLTCLSNNPFQTWNKIGASDLVIVKLCQLKERITLPEPAIGGGGILQDSTFVKICSPSSSFQNLIF